MVKTSRDGFKQWDKAFGGKDVDLANAVAQTDDDGFLLVGATKSHRSGARNFAAYLVQTSPGGDLQWEQHLGSDKTDAFAVVKLLHDQSVATGGTSDGDTGWLLRLADPYNKNAMVGLRDVAAVQTSDAVLHSEDGTLTPGRSTWVSFQISNNSDLDLPDLRVALYNRTGGTDLGFWNTNYYGKLRKGETAEIRVPVRAETNAAEGTQTLAFQS